MKRLLFLLLFIPVLSFGQEVYTYGGDVVTYGGDAVRTAGFCAEYQAVYDAYTTKPDAATAAIWNTCVKTWVSNGEWATKDVIYVYAAHTNGAGEALINWKNPGTYDATAYNAPTFTANQGFLGNGTTQYIDCNWIPSSNGVNYLQNSASQIIYMRTDIDAPGIHGIYGSADSKNICVRQRYSDVARVMVNDGSLENGANPNGSGMYINTRTAAAVKALYKNKVAIVNGTVASTGIPTHSPYCLAYNDDDEDKGWRADQVSLYAFGAGMTQTHVNNFTDPFETAMDALGTGVIP